MTLGPLMVDVAGCELAAGEAALLADPRIGGVILFARNFETCGQLASLVDAIHAIRQPPLLVAVDQEGGRVQRFRDEGFSRLPPARWLGRVYDVDEDRGLRLAGLCGWLMAAELRELGIDLSFAPVVDLDRGVSEIIGDRALHASPDVVASLGVAFIQGMRRAGMAAVAKHFPGHGAVIPDSHVELPVDQRSREEIAEDMQPYATLIDHGLSGVMIAHVRYPATDRRIASVSPYWLRTELRNNLGFSGAIFSDDLTMSATAELGAMPERVRQALAAGNDMVLICNAPEAVHETLDALEIETDPVSAGRLAALRPIRPPWRDQALRDTPDWRSAVAALEQARDAPVLELDG